MEHSFYIQDPSDPDTTYFYEAIIEQVMQESLQMWDGIYAFATGNGVRGLFFEDSAVRSFVEQGRTSLVVGIDAITDVSALEMLSALNEQFEGFQAKIFVNPISGIFHPKVSYFRHNDGKSVLIVGSGNLTSGGLRTNVEAYSVIVGTDEEIASLSAWDRFLRIHEKEIRDIDRNVLQMARRNAERIRLRRRSLQEDFEELAEVHNEIINGIEGEIESTDSRVLVAQVPAAGGRWHQIHYNKDVIENFFRIDPLV